MPFPGREQFITYTTAILFGIGSAFVGGAVGVLGAVTLDHEFFTTPDGMRKMLKVAMGGGVLGVIKYLLWMSKSSPSVLPGKGTGAGESLSPPNAPAAADQTTMVTTTTTVQETSAPVPEAPAPKPPSKPSPFPPIQS